MAHERIDFKLFTGAKFKVLNRQGVITTVYVGAGPGNTRWNPASFKQFRGPIMGIYGVKGLVNSLIESMGFYEDLDFCSK